MSDRDVTLPDQALGDVLGDLSNRLRLLNNASRWPGAAHVDSPSPVNPMGLAENTASGLWPIGYNVATVSVDPGRWVLLANVNVRLLAVSPFDYPPGGAVGARLSWTDGGIITAKTKILTMRGPELQAIVPLAYEFTSTVPMTATLTAFGGYNLTGWVDPTGSVYVTAPILIAFPG